MPNDNDDDVELAGIKFSTCD